MTKTGFLALACIVVAPVQAKRNIPLKAVAGKGSLKDSRDQAEYRTVKIGAQWWMAENLNYSSKYTWCYENTPSNCDKYGRLYSWDSAMTACPVGWHLPSDADWEALIHTVGGVDSAGKMLKSRFGWVREGNGVDEYGFNALPSGYRNPSGDFNYVGFGADFWSASAFDGKESRYITLQGAEDVLTHSFTRRGYGYSVRCVKDSV